MNPDHGMNPVLDAALKYAALGWSVLPLCPPDHVGVGKAHRGCTSPGKRPFFPDRPPAASGEWKEFQSRRATVEEINGWWNAHPRLNVGAVMGPVSGLVGIDVDDEDGEDLLIDLAQGDLPRTWEYTTGKGGRRLYRLPAGVVVVNQVYKRPGTEIEILRVLARGGQVVLPPSVHPNGSTYRWKAGRSPDDGPPADVPAWLRSEAKHERATAARPGAGELITKGGRNNYLISLAGALRKRGADEDVIHAALARTNETRLEPPLPDGEVRSVARSAMRYAPDEFTGVTIQGLTPPPPDRGFKWASELAMPEKAKGWLWEGYIPASGITLMSALWKAGKTTLLAHLLRALAADGVFLGQAVRASRVLFVSEEDEQHWVRRRDALALGDHVGFYVRPFGAGKPKPAEWKGFMGKLAGDIQRHGFDLVVFDTLAKLWPVVEENDAGAVDDALTSLWDVTKAGAAVLLMHHLRKSGGQEYTASRGSGALSAFPDIVVELNRFDAGVPQDRKRKLLAKGRFDETPDEMVIMLRDDGSQYDRVSAPVPAAPSPAEPNHLIVRGDIVTEEQKVLSVLRTSLQVWLQIDEIRSLLRQNEWGMRDSDVTVNLAALMQKGLVICRGILRSKTDPQVFAAASRATPECVGGHEIPE